MEFLIVMVVLFAVMWVVMIRPQRRRQMLHAEMQKNLAPGDEIITAGGLHGFVRRLDEDTLAVEIAPGTEVRLDRRAVATVVRADDDEEPEELDALEPDEPEPISRSES